MTTQEKQEAYCSPHIAEEMTPIPMLAVRKLQSMVHAYLNGHQPVAIEQVEGQ